MHTNLHACSAGSYLGNFSQSPTRNEVDRVNVTRGDHVEEILRNPLAMFRVIHRLELLLGSLNEQRPHNDLGKSFKAHVAIPCVYSNRIILNSKTDLPSSLRNLRSHSENDSFPLRKDLADAIDVIHRIHFTYSLHASNVTNGGLGPHCATFRIISSALKYFSYRMELCLEYLRKQNLKQFIVSTLDLSPSR